MLLGFGLVSIYILPGYGKISLNLDNSFTCCQYTKIVNLWTRFDRISKVAGLNYKEVIELSQD